MLVSFTVENWKSYKGPASFSMIASQERQHSERIPRVKKYPIRILPAAVIFGGNASGKTNFCKALSFLRDLVIKGTRPDGIIKVEPFVLDSESKNIPSHFTLAMLVDNNIYEFSCIISKSKILEEKLVSINSKNEKTLYYRQKDKYTFAPHLKPKGILKFVSEGTRDNQLFLTNSISQNLELFRPVYSWFASLEMVSPDSRFGPFDRFLDEEDPLYSAMNNLLSELDTGISHIGSEDIPVDLLPVPNEIKEELQEIVQDNMTFQIDGNGERYVVSRNEGEIIAKKLITYHLDNKGNEIKFEIRNESDGSRRIIDLLPAFLALSNSKSHTVYVIDEANRSLHALLMRKLLEIYLHSCSPESRSQLVITTHDMLLMSQEFFRRDEMWVAERDDSGQTTLYSFSDYAGLRYDKDIRKCYLQGKLGGIPKIFVDSF